MKKTTKLIAILMVVALTAALLITAAADDRIYTSPVFKLPKERIQEPEKPEAAEEPAPETEEPEADAQPGEDPDFPEDDGFGPEESGETERQVKVYSSRRDVVTEGEIITLTSELVGFDDAAVLYQWQVDRNDGEGWVDVEGATRWKHSFVANRETILYNWRLIVTVDE